MRLVVYRVFSGEHPELETWVPENPQIVSFFVGVSVGTDGGRGADDFFVRVATPAGLAALEEKNGILAGRPLVVVSHYSYEVVLSWIRAVVAGCEADTWEASVEKLRLYFNWEYDNYNQRRTLRR